MIEWPPERVFCAKGSLTLVRHYWNGKGKASCSQFIFESSQRFYHFPNWPGNLLSSNLLPTYRKLVFKNNKHGNGFDKPKCQLICFQQTLTWTVPRMSFCANIIWCMCGIWNGGTSAPTHSHQARFPMVQLNVLYLDKGTALKIWSPCHIPVNLIPLSSSPIPNWQKGILGP